MFAIKNKQGLYQSKGDGWVSSVEVEDIFFYEYWVAASQTAMKMNDCFVVKQYDILLELAGKSNRSEILEGGAQERRDHVAHLTETNRRLAKLNIKLIKYIDDMRDRCPNEQFPDIDYDAL